MVLSCKTYCMKTKIITAFTLLLFTFTMMAQNDTLRLGKSLKSFPTNSIYLEFFGHSMGFGSLNYEKVFIRKGNFYATAKGGIGWVPGRHTTMSLIMLVNGIFRVSKRFAFEGGVGTCLTYTWWDPWTEHYSFWFLVPINYTKEHPGGSYFAPLLTFQAGFRVQSPKGFLFRFNFTPTRNFTPPTEEIHVYSTIPDKVGYWFGISLGKSF